MVRPIWAYSRLLVALAAAVVSVGWTATPPSVRLVSQDGPALPRAEFLKTALPGQQPLLADYYWLQLLQQAGYASTAAEYRALYGWADLVTDLDPRFLPAYQLAGVLVPFNIGRESWVNGAESRAIIEKGLKVFPRDLPLRMYLAHDLMYFDRDYKQAADVLQSMAREPNVPIFIGQLATRLYAQASDFDAGLEFARALRDAATTDEDRAFFERRMVEIQAERVLQQIDAAAMVFARREGRQPTSVLELVTANDLKLMPVDPLGGDITIDDFGRARTSAARFRLELYEASSKALAPFPEGGQH